MSLSGEYLSIVGGFMFLQAVLTAMAVIIRNHGMTKISMYVTVGMNVLNTGLDILFVLGFDMGVSGVAIATSISRVLGTAVLAAVLFKKVEKPSIFKYLKPFPLKDVGSMLKIGIPGRDGDLFVQPFAARHHLYRAQLSHVGTAYRQNLRAEHHDVFLRFRNSYRAGVADNDGAPDWRGKNR